MAFTEREAKAAKWPGKDVLLSAGDGLFLNVRRTSKTWVIRRRRRGRMAVTTVGPYPDITVKEARAKATAAALADAPDGVTVAALAAEYQTWTETAHKRPELFAGYARRAIVPELGARKVADVTPAQVAALVKDYGRTNGPRTADALRSNLAGLFAYAVENGLRKDNPAKDIGRRVTGYTYEPRDRTLTPAEIRELWTWDSPNARVLRFCLATGLRIGEAQNGHARRRFWHVPAQFSKNGRAHWVYLTATALAQLPLPDCTATNVQAWLKRRLGDGDRYTPHDTRRSAATLMSAAGVEPFVVERVLGHTLQGVMGIYNRASYARQRIRAARTLEAAVLRIVTPKQEAPGTVSSAPGAGFKARLGTAHHEQKQA